MPRTWDEINRTSGSYKARTWDSVNEDAKRQREEEDRKRQDQARRDAENKNTLAPEETKVDKVLNKVADYTVAGFNVASKIVKGGLDAYNAASDFIAKKAEEHPKITDAVMGSTPFVGDVYKLKKTVSAGVQDAFDKGVIDEKTKNWLDDPFLTALNTNTGAKITGEIAKDTSNLPLKAIARVKSIGDDTYDEALSSLLAWRNDATNPRWQKLLADVQDSGAQSAVGVLLSVGASFLTKSPKAGQTVAMAYYGALSAEDQRQQKGSVTSKKNIVVDTLGDIALNGLVESSLKGILKDSAKRTLGNVAVQTTKGVVVEGSTEVSQTMLKYANDYNDAKTDQDKLSVIEQTRNYVLNGGLLNEFLVGGISGGIITGFATMAGMAATGGKRVDPSMQPKKNGGTVPPDDGKPGVPQLSADIDIAKLRDLAITFKDSAEKNQEDPVAIEQYAAVRDVLSDYEIAFKERPVYISDNEQDNPIMQIETVAYPDGKVAYRFSADVGNTSITSNFDNQNTVTSQKEAIKAASETIKTWVEDQLATASDEAEAMKFQRIYDEADALLTGKAKFVEIKAEKPISPTGENGIVESNTTGEAIAKEASNMGSDQGGLSDFTLNEIKKEDYSSQTVSIALLRSQDKDLDEYLKTGGVREFNGEPNAMDPVVSSSGEVIDGYNRIAQAIADGKTEISVLKGKEKPVTETKKKSKSVTKPEEKAQTKPEKTVEKATEKIAKEESVKTQKEKVVGDRAISEADFTKAITEDMATSPVEAFKLGDRSTRGKDGKFTGSEAIDAVGSEEIKKALSGPEMLSFMKEMQKRVNPEIRNVLAIKVAEKILAGGENSQFETTGLFNPDIMTMFLDGSLSKAETEYLFMHETNHAGWVLLPSDMKKKVIAWYKGLPESDKINLYADEKGMNGGLMFSRYESISRTRSDPEAFMAEETFNRHINKNPDERSELRQTFDDIVTALLRLIQRILDVVYESKRFGKLVRNRQITEAYYNAFRNKSGFFESSKMMKKALELRGVKPGTIDFIGETKGRGVEFSRVKENTVKKEDTKTARFAKIINRRRELRALKKKKETAFMESKAGMEVAAKTEIAIENYVAPNENVVQGILNNPYFQKEGNIKDAMGDGFLMVKKGRYVVVEKTRQDTYFQRGYQTVIEIDSLASEAGFENGQEYLNDQLNRRRLPDTAESAIRRILKDSDQIYSKVEDELHTLEKELETAKEGKGAFYQGMRVGSAIMRKNYNEKLKIFRDRKSKVRGAKDFFNLSDSDFKKIGGNRDIQTMGESEFQGFLNHLQVQAEKVILRSQAMELLMGQINEKQLRKYMNIARALGLPNSLSKMDTLQIHQLDQALEFSQENDVFLTQRELETVNRTDWGDIKTERELLGKIKENMGFGPERFKDLTAIDVGDFTPWQKLARTHPFFNWLVGKRVQADIAATKEYISIEEQTNKLAGAAIKSRRKLMGIKERIFDIVIPTQPILMGYLESDAKESYAKENKMTSEELKYAEFIIGKNLKFYEYLKQFGTKEIENYMTHSRRNFFEALKEGGLSEAFSNMFAAEAEEAAMFKILSGQTGEIIAFDKFLGNMLHRTGTLTPSQNVTRVFLEYSKAIQKKIAMDKFVPEAMVALQAHKAIVGTTEKGASNDPTLESFVKEFLNTAKGRKIKFITKQGSRGDTLLRAGVSVVSLKYLGGNIASAIGNIMGDFAAITWELGIGEQLRGVKRSIFNPIKTYRINKQFRYFTGRNPLVELFDPKYHLPARVKNSLMALMGLGAFQSNKFFLRSKMTAAEFQTGVIEDKRMVEIANALSRVKPNQFFVKSLAGSTTAGQATFQFGGWAIAITNTMLSDGKEVLKMLKNRDVKQALTSREAQKMLKFSIMAGILMWMTSLFDVPDDDYSLKGRTIRSIKNNLNTLVQALQFTTDISNYAIVLREIYTTGKAFYLLASGEEYNDDAPDGSYQAGDLKGTRAVGKAFTPSLIKQFTAPESKSQEKVDKDALIEKYRLQGMDPIDLSFKVAEELGYDPEDDTYKADVRAIEKQAIQKNTTDATGKRTERLMKSRLKTTRVRILKEYQKEMSEQEFKDYLLILFDGKIISKPVFDEFDIW